VSVSSPMFSTEIPLNGDTMLFGGEIDDVTVPNTAIQNNYIPNYSLNYNYQSDAETAAKDDINKLLSQLNDVPTNLISYTDTVLRSSNTSPASWPGPDPIVPITPNPDSILVLDPSLAAPDPRPVPNSLLAAPDPGPVPVPPPALLRLADDDIRGGFGKDLLRGGDGDDTVRGGAGGDLIFGDLPQLRSTTKGDDSLAGGAGSDSIAGGGGFDVAYFELPRRAHTVSWNSSFQFPLSTEASAPTESVRGISVSAGTGPAAQVDRLVEVEELRFPDGRIVLDPADPIARVHRVFEAALDRAPDPIGLNFWAERVAAGQPLNAVANAIAQSPEFQARYGALDDAAFVRQLYRNTLDRPGDADGVAGWTKALDAGGSRGQVLVAFANSQESIAGFAKAHASGVWDQDERAAQLARLYDAAFDRKPDVGGFLANKAALDAGAGLEQLARGFARSPEFAALYGGPDAAPAALVNALYANALDRPADAAGLDFWTQRIASGAATREQVIVAFSESQEHQVLMLPSIEGGIVFA